MKKILIATLSTAMVLGMAGCATQQEVYTAATSAPDASVALTDDQVDKPLGGGQDELGDNLGGSDAVVTEASSDKADPLASDTIPGTWQTASMTSNAEGMAEPSRYLQFTATDIKYGQMKDGAFVEEYADKISKLEKTAAGGFMNTMRHGQNPNTPRSTPRADPSLSQMREVRIKTK